MMDIAIAVEQLVPNARFRRAATYEELAATWLDERPLPSYAEITSAWDVVSQANQAAAEAQAARETNRADVQGRFVLSALKSKSPAEIYSYIETQIDGWSSLADAKADLKTWLPLIASGFAWLVIEDEQTA